jgi:UDP-N-acetylmuramoyl-tripeptide--D-alanyl-D-alanine ligase
MAGLLRKAVRKLRQGAKARLQARRDVALRREAAAARQNARARFIGITGSSGKSTATSLLAHILSAQGSVQLQVKFNDRRSVMRAVARAARDNKDFVVVEVATGRPGLLKPTAVALQPDVAVVTMVALEHKSSFRNIEAIAAEKAELVGVLRPGGLAILNGDDPLVAAMALPPGVRTVTFGRSEGSTYRATDLRAAFPERLSLTLTWPGGSLALQTRFAGPHFWLPTLAAVTAALELGVPPEVAAARVATFEPLFERCGVMSVPGGPHFIVDSTKAPWHSLALAFETVAPATAAPRRRIVLGHISDTSDSNRRYRDAYRMARAAADQVIFVGDHAHRSKASQQDRDEGRFFAFATTAQVAAHIRATAIPGEVILLKGSVDLHLERIALAWTRDVKCWINACSNKSGCIDCGRYEDSFDWHRGHKRRGRMKRFLRRLWPEPAGSDGQRGPAG